MLSKLTKILRSATILAVVTMFGISVTVPQVAWAISPQQLKIYQDDIDYYNHEEALCQPGAGTTAPNLTVGPDFNLGDLANGVQRRINLMKALMADFGFTAEQAAGIIGNFMQESGGPELPPDVNQGGVKGPPALGIGGYGWAQWSGPRQRAFIDFAVANGYMASENVNATDAANYAWLKEELGTDYTGTVEAVKAAATVEAATIAFEAEYEKAGKPNIAARQAFAQQALTEYNGGGGAAAPGGTAAGGAAGPAGGCANTAGNNGAAIVGQTAFPLKTTKSNVNGEIFVNGTTTTAEHPYTAYDIITTTGTEVVAFMGGVVNLLTTDVCGGRMISIYNAESNIVVSYLHLSMVAASHVKDGDVLTVGQRVGEVGTTAEGCTVPHLHIDAAQGETRPACARANCPAANAAQFVDIGPQLYETYQILPE